MRKAAAALALCLALAGPAWAQKKAVPLNVVGDTVLVVKSLPCKVVAPAGDPDKTVYLWSVPDAIKADADEGVLTVKEAPKGTYKVRVVVIRLAENKLSKDSGEVELIIGDGPTPPDPPVPPVPPDELTKALRDAYRADDGQDRAKHLVSLAALYRQAEGLDLRDFKTAGDLYAVLTKASRSLLPLSALKGVRTVIQARLKEILPTTADAELTQDHRANARSLFGRLAKALESIAAEAKR